MLDLLQKGHPLSLLNSFLSLSFPRKKRVIMKQLSRSGSKDVRLTLRLILGYIWGGDSKNGIHFFSYPYPIYSLMSEWFKQLPREEAIA